MINIHHGFTKNIPYLEVVAQELQNEKLPGVIFVHGFTSAKEHNLHYAYYLAMRGFRVVLPEAQLHGERYANVTETELNLSFWDIVISTIHELQYFVDEFSQKKLIDIERVGVAGTSMGGIVTFGALTQYQWIKAAVALMGTPAYVSFAKSQMNAMKHSGAPIPLSNSEAKKLFQKLEQYDLSIKPERLNERPLLFWHSESDHVVPFEPTYKFFLKAKTYYTKQPKNIHFIRDKTSGHKVSRKGVLETVRWFEKFLEK